MLISLFPSRKFPPPQSFLPKQFPKGISSLEHPPPKKKILKKIYVYHNGILQCYFLRSLIVLMLHYTLVINMCTPICADDTTLLYNLNSVTNTLTLDSKTIYKYCLTIAKEIIFKC